jgi:hypothetical protein
MCLPWFMLTSCFGRAVKSTTVTEEGANPMVYPEYLRLLVLGFFQAMQFPALFLACYQSICSERLVPPGEAPGTSDHSIPACRVHVSIRDSQRSTFLHQTPKGIYSYNSTNNNSLQRTSGVRNVEATTIDH